MRATRARELGQALLAARGSAGELLAAPPGGAELPPGALELAAPAELLLADESVEDVELVGRAREPPLLELPGHGEKPLDERRPRLARTALRPQA